VRALVAALLSITLTVTTAAAQSAPDEIIGYSQGGQPLIIQHLGSGQTHVLILGGQHGGPERNTVQLVEGLYDYFSSNPEQIPSGVELDLLSMANPDGVADGSRQFLSGVDPNRNWGGPDWRSDAYDSNARFRVGLGGPEPFSEQETRALADWVLRVHPALVVNYHSAGNFMFGGRDGLAGDISTAYADASGYYWPQPGRGSSPLPYQASGSMNVWLRETGIPGILVELSTPSTSEISRNLAGLKASLGVLAAANQPAS
jgi:Zinc carboxypeptidase